MVLKGWIVFDFSAILPAFPVDVIPPAGFIEAGIFFPAEMRKGINGGRAEGGTVGADVVRKADKVFLAHVGFSF